MTPKSLLAVAAGACVLVSISAFLPGCIIEWDGNRLIGRPAEGAKPREIPPTKRVRHIIDGECVEMFQAPGGQWYCFPCEIPTGLQVAGQPCGGPPASQFVPGGAAFPTFINALLLQEGVTAESEVILEHFGLDTWSPGDAAPIYIAIQLIDTDEDFAQIVIISRSDWDWPDESVATVEVLAFPDSTGWLPSLTDGTPDAIAFRVSGTLVDVAESIASISDTGFTWTHVSTTTNSTYVFSTEPLVGGGFYTAVRVDNAIVWDNQ